jgi:hypothetical protein
MLVRVNRALAATALGLTLLAVMIAGCARPSLEVGPDAARLVIDYAAQVDPMRLRSARLWEGFSSGISRFRSMYGPYWRLRAMVVLEPDGQELLLPRAADGESQSMRGESVRGEAVFLITPGVHKVRISLCAELHEVWQERASSGRWYYTRDARGRMVRVFDEPMWQERSRRKKLDCFKYDREVTAVAGGEIRLEIRGNQPDKTGQPAK